MFAELKIQKFKGIKHLEISQLGQINLVVGGNNSGKTTLLESLLLLAGATNPRLPLNIMNLRGINFFKSDLWPAFFYDMTSHHPIEITSKTQEDLKEHKLRIYLKVKEFLKSSSTSTRSHKTDTASNGIGTKLQDTPVGLELEYTNPAGDKHKSALFEKDENISFENADATPFKGLFLSPLSLYDWRAAFDEVQRKKRLPELISLLKTIEPKISDLRMNVMGMVEADVGLSRLLPLNFLGGGVAKVTSVITQILNYENGLVLIDEIENGLHRTVQKTLWEAIFNWALSYNVQIFATTHSYECLQMFNEVAGSFLQPEVALFRLEREDGQTKAIRYNREELSAALESNWEVR